MIIGNPILSGGLTPKLIEKEIDTAGVYVAKTDDADGYSRVRVTAAGGGGGSDTAVLMTKAEWDALPIASKQAYEFVGVIDRTNGVTRGRLVYGPAFMNTWLDATPGAIVCEVNLLDEIQELNGQNVWGNNVIVDGVYRATDDTIYTNATSNSNKIPISVELPTVTGSFTAYIVTKYISGSNRMMMSFGNRDATVSGGMGLLWNGKYNIVLSLWGNDTIFTGSDIYKYEDYICAALGYEVNSQKSYGYALRSSKNEFYSLSKNRGVRDSSHIVVGKTFPTKSTPSNDERTNANVAYLCVTDAFDGESQIVANLVNIANSFEDTYVKPV